jgi:N-acetylglucosaminylphosphatidylinositol deacetylase
MREEANLFLLVLSNGGWEGLGKVREKEMEKAARHLGFKDFKVVDDQNIPDGPDVTWDKQIIADHLASYIKSLEAAGNEIGSIVTFDEYGVSHHPNHIQVHHGCMHLHNSKLFPKVDIYTLTTVSTLRKYDSFLDIFLSSSNEVNYYLPTPFPAVGTMMIHYT